MSNYNFIAYAAMSDEEILIALDAEVFASTFEAEEPDREVRLRRIVTWFTKEEDKLRQAICLNEKVRKAHSAASKDGAELLQPTTDTITYDDGSTEEVYGFDVPVKALDETFDLALIGTKGKWYDHEVSVSNPVKAE